MRLSDSLVARGRRAKEKSKESRARRGRSEVEAEKQEEGGKVGKATAKEHELEYGQGPTSALYLYRLSPSLPGSNYVHIPPSRDSRAHINVRGAEALCLCVHVCVCVRAHVRRVEAQLGGVIHVTITRVGQEAPPSTQQRRRVQLLTCHRLCC